MLLMISTVYMHVQYIVIVIVVVVQVIILYFIAYGCVTCNNVAKLWIDTYLRMYVSMHVYVNSSETYEKLTHIIRMYYELYY